MNIRVLTILLTALCLWSCSSEQDSPVIPEPQPNPDLKAIGFGGNSGAWQDAPTSRTRQNGLENLFQSFRVWSYKTTGNTDGKPSSPQEVMNGYQVLYNTDGATGWDYIGLTNPDLQTAQTVKYWDYAATSYRFFAYSPFHPDITAKTDDATAQAELSFHYEYSDTATATSTPYISELWFAMPTASSANAVNNGINQYGNCVTLTFAPLIAKVRFKFSYPSGTTTISVKDIKFGDSRYLSDPSKADTPLKGTVTAAYPLTGTPASTTPQLSWSAPNETDTPDCGQLVLDTPYEETNDSIHLLEDSKLYGKWYYVPPLNIIPYEQGAYTITAIIDGNHSAATVPSEYMQWKAGYQYTYIFKITEAGSLITFTDAEVERWVAGPDTDNNGNGTESW